MSRGAQGTKPRAGLELVAQATEQSLRAALGIGKRLDEVEQILEALTADGSSAHWPPEARRALAALRQRLSQPGARS